MKPITRICIDLETLGTRTDAPVISIGAVAWHAGHIGPVGGFSANIDMAAACDIGRASGDTIAWWLKQPADAREALSDNPQTPHMALFQFDHWIAQWLTACAATEREVVIIANAPSFDLSILARQYRCVLNQPLPWKYWQERDWRTERDTLIRTLYRIGADTSLPARSSTRHRAIDDARWQLEVLETLELRLLAGIERMGSIVARSTAGEVSA